MRYKRFVQTAISWDISDDSLFYYERHHVIIITFKEIIAKYVRAMILKNKIKYKNWKSLHHVAPKNLFKNEKIS